MKISKLNKKNITKLAKQTKKELENNKLVIIPSDTVYVLAVNAMSDKAVNKIYNFKGRKFGKGISVFLNNTAQINKYCYLKNSQKKILNSLLPGPFTVILKSKQKTAPEIEPGDQTIGIRIINQNFIQKLTQICDFPITATSANISGKGPHYSITAFLNTLSNKKKKEISLIIDAGVLPKNPPSTVISLVQDNIEILRPGKLNPKPVRTYISNSEAETKQIAKKIFNNYLLKNLKKHAVIIILKGDLGTGKTVFAKAIGELVDQKLKSPSFTLLDEYKINNKIIKYIYHLDLYRIQKEKEIKELKLNRFLKPGNLMLIEWGEKLSTLQSLKTKENRFYFIEILEKSRNKRTLNLCQV